MINSRYSLSVTTQRRVVGYIAVFIKEVYNKNTPPDPKTFSQNQQQRQSGSGLQPRPGFQLPTFTNAQGLQLGQGLQKGAHIGGDGFGLGGGGLGLGGLGGGLGLGGGGLSAAGDIKLNSFCSSGLSGVGAGTFNNPGSRLSANQCSRHSVNFKVVDVFCIAV